MGSQSCSPAAAVEVIIEGVRCHVAGVALPRCSHLIGFRINPLHELPDETFDYLLPGSTGLLRVYISLPLVVITTRAGTCSRSYNFFFHGAYCAVLPILEVLNETDYSRYCFGSAGTRTSSREICQWDI